MLKEKFIELSTFTLNTQYIQHQFIQTVRVR